LDSLGFETVCFLEGLLLLTDIFRKQAVHIYCYWFLVENAVVKSKSPLNGVSVLEFLSKDKLTMYTMLLAVSLTTCYTGPAF
jgi:hypothetical protein